jgi:hypothetical protein
VTTTILLRSAAPTHICPNGTREAVRHKDNVDSRSSHFTCDRLFRAVHSCEHLPWTCDCAHAETIVPPTPVQVKLREAAHVSHQQRAHRNPPTHTRTHTHRTAPFCEYPYLSPTVRKYTCSSREKEARIPIQTLLRGGHATTGAYFTWVSAEAETKVLPFPRTATHFFATRRRVRSLESGAAMVRRLTLSFLSPPPLDLIMCTPLPRPITRIQFHR